MRRLLKILAWVLAGLLVLVVVAIVSVSLFFNPNDYRETIASVVQRETGRKLDIAGDIKLSFFPWLGVEVNQVQLSNAKGFGTEPFAQVREVQVRVALLPLFRKKVEVDTVVLNGLRLHLARNSHGVSNWQDLVKKQAAPSAPAPKPQPQAKKGPGLEALAVNGIALNDAAVTWQDAQTGLKANARDLSLTSGAIRLGEPFPVSFQTRIEANQPKVAGQIAMQARVTADLQAERFAVDDVVLTTDLASPLLPTGQVAAKLTTSAAADLKAGTAQVPALTLTAWGTRLSAQLKASSIMTKPDASGSLSAEVVDPKAALAVAGPAGAKVDPAALKGAGLKTSFQVSLGHGTATIAPLEISAAGVNLSARAEATNLSASPTLSGSAIVAPFVPREVMAALGITIPEPADPSVLTKAALSTRFAGSTDRLAINQLKVQLDDSTLTGEVSVANFTAPAIRFQLALDRIDVDRYLPPPAKTPAAKAPPAGTPAESGAAAAQQLPLDALRKLLVDGTARIGALKAANLRSTDISATVKAAHGLIELQPLGAKLYGGTYAGGTVVDVRQATPKIAIDERLSGVQAGPLLKDLMGKDYVTGAATVSANLTATGAEVPQLLRTLNGQAAFQFQNGAVSGINIAQAIRKATALAKHQPAPPEQPEKTDFAELKGTLQVANGLVQNRDLDAKTPLLRIRGAGTANLVTQQLDYEVQAAVVETLKGQGGKELQDLRNLTVPVRISGPFSDPKVKVEIGKVLEARARQQIEQEKQKAQQRLNQQLQNEKNKVEQRLQDQLKGLLRR